MKKSIVSLLMMAFALVGSAQSLDTLFVYSSMDYNQEQGTSPIYQDECYMSLTRTGTESIVLQKNHLYTVKICSHGVEPLIYTAYFTCNLDDPEERELFGHDNGSLVSEDGCIGLYNILSDIVYDESEYGDCYPPGSTGDWTDEDYEFFEIRRGFHLNICTSSMPDFVTTVYIFY